VTDSGSPTVLRQVFDDLVRFETRLWAEIDAELQSKSGVTLANLNAMLVIDRIPNCRVLDIAEALSITVGGASQAVDRLQASGRCLRKANPEDRRSSVIALTPHGVASLSGALPVFDHELDRWLRRPLDPALLTQFGTALGALRSSGGDAPAAL
jgi:DNA-binding MarR family transcriptional regulator